jgi:sulfite dehydrogenase (cytochrome) subunit A
LKHGKSATRGDDVTSGAHGVNRVEMTGMQMHRSDHATVDRRQWLRQASAAGFSLAFASGCSRPAVEETVKITKASLRFPGKLVMRVINDRPPCLETPWSYYQRDLTPNEAFYVRWHLQLIPTKVDLRTWRLRIGGHVERPRSFSMDDLRRMEPTSLIAVNQCSGNSRELFQPRIPGAQWGNGAMGNARWVGVPLRHLLSKAGVKSQAVDVSFLGLDRGGLPTIPDFVKSLPIDKALQPEILVAYEMNGEPLPMLNGFPVRLVVPGWYATYWLKSLTDIAVLPQRFEGFWMSKAYRIPNTPNAQETPESLAEQTTPIERMNVRSFFTGPVPEAGVAVGQPCQLEGIAFDGGDGIQRVEVSVDGGINWREATLGDDLGQFSFRRWRMTWRPETSGVHRLQVRASNRTGETQIPEAGWNRAGYMRNVIEELSINAS